ncbi:MAG TPA: lipopolysaccharide biosynthesis protein [Devosia sp.]|jgi:hypothetical protein|uniref:lipopolysaccharide biosynthesis protein n=1 Tax=Devosia sp. TaxID=1871048 RepID=UPI002DDD9CE2|nr:lipopolysaccharide biosynthesis protein [Devosia sp.]HEV2515461.1 lipopolysaccharide biosynthesis protein [Devosia sp.]
MRIARLIALVANRIALTIYVWAVKLWEWPGLLADERPQFIVDEIVSPARGDTYAIVVKYARFGLDDGVAELVAALVRQGVNVIVVCNGQPRPDHLDRLRAGAHRLLVRRNIGRDFGAYRAATLLLEREGLVPDRLLYFNDSVIYLDGPELDRLITALRVTPAGMLGAFENHETRHHLGSFTFGQSAEVVADPAVRRFWRRYRAYSLRPHAILRGEIRLTTLVKSRGHRLDVVYSAQRLASELQRLPANELAGLWRYLPSRTRGSEPVAGPDTRSRRDRLIDQLMASFMDSSQAHYAFGLFHRVLKAPIIKKDLLGRGVYLEHQCLRILDDLPPDTAQAVVRLLANRGRPVQLRGLHRFRYRNGLI